MSLDKVLKTVYVAGDFGNNNRGGEFRPFTGSVGPQALDYSAFVDFFGVSTPELGVLDEGNPFYRILRPWSPPGSPVAAGASEMAAVVVGALPGIVREAAKALSEFEAAVQPLGKLDAYKANGEKDEGETPKAYAELLDACCSGNIALEKMFAKLRIKDKLTLWASTHNELLKRLRAADRTFAEFAKRSNKKSNLFQVLLKKRIQDVVDGSVKEIQNEFNAIAREAGFEAVGFGDVLDVTSDGNDLPKAAFIAALVTRDPNRFDKGYFDCNDLHLKDLVNKWNEFVKTFDRWQSGAVVPSGQVDAAWEKFIARRKADWRKKYLEEMPDLRELELRVFFYAFAGSKSLSEERIAELAYFAMNGIGLASRADAQAALAKANSLGIEKNRSEKPSSQKDLEDSDSPDVFADSTEGSWHGEDEKNIRKHANLIRVLTFYMSVVNDPNKRKLIASMLLTTRGKATNLMKHLKSEGYLNLFDGLVGEASKAYRELLATREKMSSAKSRAGTASSTEDDQIPGTGATTEVQPDSAEDTVTVTTSSQGQENASGALPDETLPDETLPDGTLPDGTQTDGTQTDGTPTDAVLHDDGKAKADQSGTNPPTVPSQLAMLKEAFRELGHPVDSGEASVVSGSKPGNFSLDELYVSLHKAMSQLAADERASEQSANGQLEKSGLQYLTIMFMQRQGIDFGDKEAASLGWIFELSRFGNDQEVLKNVPLNQLLTMSSDEELSREWQETEDDFDKMLGKANEKLSKLYGVELLLKSAPKASIIYFYNGNVASAIAKLATTPAYFSPANIGLGATQGVPTVIYFADQQPAALQSLSQSTLVNTICPVFLDGGPDFSKSKLWNALTIPANCRACVSLAGPGIRLRGATRVDGNFTTQNNGLPSSPLIPAGALLLAALLDGAFKDDNYAELILKNAEDEAEDSGYFPEQAIVPKSDASRNLRFFLQRENEGEYGDLIARTKHVLAKSGLVYDLAIWLAWLAKQKQIAPHFEKSTAGEVTVTLAGIFPSWCTSTHVKISQVGAKGVAPRAWQVTSNGNQIAASSEYLQLLHPASL